MTTPAEPPEPFESSDQAFQRLVDEGLVPKLSSAAMGLLMHPNDKIDAHFAVQLGAMVLLDKPILAVVDPGYKVPAKLRAVADEIVVWRIGTDKKPLEEALLRMSRRFGPPDQQEKK